MHDSTDHSSEADRLIVRIVTFLIHNGRSSTKRIAGACGLGAIAALKANPDLFVCRSKQWHLIIDEDFSVVPAPIFESGRSIISRYVSTPS
jgi:hypothetical protein